jgi:hypothetical protein
MTRLSLKVLLDHIANNLLIDDDKDGLVWFADGNSLHVPIFAGASASPTNTAVLAAVAGGGRPRQRCGNLQ